MAAGQDCTVDVTGGTGDINQSVADSATSPATAEKQIVGTGGTTTINSGAGIVNRDTGSGDAPLGVAVYSAPGGTNIGTINNQGIIANSHGSNAVISLAGSGVTTINNGTTGNATIQALGTYSIGIRIGIDDGPATAGGLVLNQGSATSTGQILVANGDSAAVLSHATGDVTINNVNGVLQGGGGVYLATNGAINITNGNGTTASRITGLSRNAIQIGDSAAEAAFAPTFQVTNNAGSTIEALGAQGTAIMVGSNVGGASTILNHGTITATGGTAIDLTGNTSATNHVTVTNSGTITGTVKLGSGDTANLGGGTITGDLTATASSARVNVTASSAMNGNIGTTSIHVPVAFAGDYTLTMGSGKSIYGNVSSGTNGQGTITFGGSASIYTDMGQSGAGLKALNINGGTVDLDNTNNYVGTTTIATGATLALCSANSCSSGGSFHGDWVVNGGTLDLTRGGAVQTLAAGPNGSTGAFTTTSGSTIKTKVSDNGTTSGAGNTSNITTISASGVANLATGTAVYVNSTNALNVSNGARYILVSGTGAATVGTITTTGNSSLLSWSVLRGDDASLGQANSAVYLVASKRELSSMVTSSAAQGAATALTAISTASGMSTLVNAVSNLASSEMDKAVKQLAPSSSVGAATTVGSASATTANINTIGARADNIRTAQAGGKTGVSSGDELRGIGLWMQGLGSGGSQDRRQGQDGYDAFTGGLAFGGDVQVAEPVRVGAAFSYAHTSVSSTGDSTGSGADINSYQGTLYANYTGKPWYVDGTLVYGRHNYDSTRAISFTGFDAKAKGTHTGDQYTAQVAGGYPVIVANTLITPNASLAYSLLNQSAYAETGAGGANLAVSDQSNTSVRSGLGIKASKSFSNGTTRLVPEARLTWLHEFNDKAPDQAAKFAAGGSSFTTSGARAAQDSAVIGIGLNIAQANQISVTANYDAELKDRYVGHNGTLQARMEF